MNPNDFENLKLIPKLFDEIQSIKLGESVGVEKKWLTTRELAEYIGYSLDAINKMVKENVFLDGVHYHKPQKKLLFDKQQIDNWIVGIKDDKHQNKISCVVDSVLQGIE